MAVLDVILLNLSFVLDHFLREEVCTESLFAVGHGLFIFFVGQD